MIYLALTISFFTFIICLKLRRPYFILLLPIFQLAGLIFILMSRYETLPVEYAFLVSYIELILLIVFVIEEKINDKISKYLLFFPILSLPTLIFAKSHLFFSLFLTLIMIMAAWLYPFFLKNMKWMIEKRFFELIAISWLIAGMAYKAFYSFTLNNTPLTFSSFLMNAILVRKGGIYGSNFLGGIEVTLLPLIEWPWLFCFITIYLLSTFSRGVYFLLFLFWLYKIRSIKKELLVKIVTIFILFTLFAYFLLPLEVKNSFMEFVSDRMTGSKTSVGIKIEDFKNVFSLLKKFKEEERFEISKDAIEIWRNNCYIGIGLGGFQWGMREIGAIPYSNAHNIYLTLLVEGGILFLIGFLGLYIYMLYLSFLYDKKTFFSLIIFALNGLFNGELYETSGQASLINYYLIIFILAYLKYREKKIKTQVKEI